MLQLPKLGREFKIIGISKTFFILLFACHFFLKQASF